MGNPLLYEDDLLTSTTALPMHIRFCISRLTFLAKFSNCVLSVSVLS